MFRIANFDITFLNFSFLSGFHQLNTLHITNSTHFHLHGLPPLPNLVALSCTNITGLNEWNDFPILINGIEQLEIDDSNLNDESADRILHWIVSGSSSKTLGWIDLRRNSLTRIPRPIKDFKRLVSIFLGYQQYPGFGFLQVSSLPAVHLSVSGCHITVIQPGIFQGFFFTIDRNHANINKCFKLLKVYI